MAELWLPGVTRRDTGRGLSLLGGPRIFTWHTTESGYHWSAWDMAGYLNSIGADTMFVFHPITGELVQMLPADKASRTLQDADWPLDPTNTHGDFHGQVEVIGRAATPWTDDLTDEGRATLRKLLDFLRSHGVPDRWAHDYRPPEYPATKPVQKFWVQESGHFHHAGWVDNNHGDPGAIEDPWKAAGGPLTPPETPPEDEVTQEQYDALMARLEALDKRAGNIYKQVHYNKDRLENMRLRDVGADKVLGSILSLLQRK